MQRRLALFLAIFTMLSIVGYISFAKRAQHPNLVTAASNSHTEGALQVVDPEKGLGASCPLKHTDVKAEISGFISRVVVTQQFENPFKEKIEAIYTFPLSQNAAVDDMT
ncbi:MAG: VIT domain-containing protein, partial [Blastocatellia bacterium]